MMMMMIHTTAPEIDRQQKKEDTMTDKIGMDGWRRKRRKIRRRKGENTRDLPMYLYFIQIASPCLSSPPAPVYLL